MADGPPGLGGEDEVVVSGEAGGEAVALELSSELGHQDHIATAGVGLETAASPSRPI